MRGWVVPSSAPHSFIASACPTLVVIVDSVARHDVVMVPEAATVAQAATLMRDRRVGSVLVARGGAPVGILTERDVAWRVVAEGRDPTRTLAAEVMSSPLATIEAAASLEEAAERMRALGVKRLVVVVGTQLRGIVTVTEVAYAKPELSRRFMDAWVKPRWED